MESRKVLKRFSRPSSRSQGRLKIQSARYGFLPDPVTDKGPHLNALTGKKEIQTRLLTPASAPEQMVGEALPEIQSDSGDESESIGL